MEPLDDPRRIRRRARLKQARRSLGPRYEQSPDRKTTIDILDRQIASLGAPPQAPHPERSRE
jgi:hypothetical protein